MRTEDKTALIDEIAKDFQEVPTLFVADYRGLDMPSITDLRQQLRATDATFRVVKNTLARKAAEKAGYDDVADLFVGPTAVTFVKGDAAAVAKVLDKVAKTTNILEVRGGIMDGAKVDAAQVKQIATLPSREVILTMLVSAVNAPVQQGVSVLAGPMRQFVGVLDAYIEKRTAEEGAAA